MHAAINTIKTIANIITGPVIATATKLNLKLSDIITTANLHQLASAFDTNSINNQGIQKVIDSLAQDPAQTVQDIIQKEGLAQISDTSVLNAFVQAVLVQFPSQVAEYRAGKVNLLGFLVGQCMKESKGQGNPQIFGELFKASLDQ